MTSQEIRKIVDEHLNAEARHDAELPRRPTHRTAIIIRSRSGCSWRAGTRLLPVTRRALPRSPTAR
jgi:hypothetical protein